MRSGVSTDIRDQGEAEVTTKDTKHTKESH